MMLDPIVELARKRVDEAKKKVPLGELISWIYCNGEAKNFNKRGKFAFEQALKNEGISFICEVKKASPSRGLISPDFPYRDIAKEYEDAGARAISVLTEPGYFMGSSLHLEEISGIVSIPVLRKDFIIDEYQIYESKILGADALLLICRLLSPAALRKFISACDELGLSALVETHTKEEIDMAVEAGARVIGVNNRDLDTFEVDINNCIKLRNHVPQDIIYVAESGIHRPDHISMLENAGVDAVLIGEALMGSPDKKATLSYLRGGKATVKE